MISPPSDLKPLKPAVAGYPNRYSVFPGESFTLHNTLFANNLFPSVLDSRQCTLRFYRLGRFDDTGKDAWTQLDLPKGMVSVSADTRNTFVTEDGREFTYNETNAAWGPKDDINPPHTSAEDWNWPASLKVRVPKDWKSGVYRALLTHYHQQGGASSAVFHDIIFVVKRPLEAPAPARILYALSVASAHAYSQSIFSQAQFGDLTGGAGNDFYDNTTTGMADRNSASTAWKVTLRRPLADDGKFQIFGRHDYLMIPWLLENGYTVDFCTDLDLDQDDELSLLSRSKLLLSVGHAEYWSTDMRRNVESFIQRGGNVAFFGGNICMWRVHMGDFDPSLGVFTSMTCDKGTSEQIAAGSGADAWWKVKLKEGGVERTWPENMLTGVATRNGGVRETTFSPDDPFRPASKSKTDDGALSANMMPGYKVQHADHWLYNSPFVTGLKNGDVFGTPNSGQPEDGSVVGYECDGAAFESDPENPDFIRPTGVDGTPASFVILAWAQLDPFVYISSGAERPRRRVWGVLPRENTTYNPDNSPILQGPYAATLGLYTVDGGGTVFTCATIDWVRVLCGARLSPAPQGIKTFYPTASSDKDRPAIWGPETVDKLTRNVLENLSLPSSTTVA